MMPPVSLKTIETRSWPTNVRGPVAIHAAKRQSRELAEFFNENNVGEPGKMKPFDMITGSFYDLPFGAVVGFGNLVDCVKMSDMVKSHGLVMRLTSIEQAWGNYSTPDRYAWIFEDLVSLDKPLPWKGKQGFFNVDLSRSGPDELSDVQKSNRGWIGQTLNVPNQAEFRGLE